VKTSLIGTMCGKWNRLRATLLRVNVVCVLLFRDTSNIFPSSWRKWRIITMLDFVISHLLFTVPHLQNFRQKVVPQSLEHSRLTLIFLLCCESTKHGRGRNCCDYAGWAICLLHDHEGLLTLTGILLTLWFRKNTHKNQHTITCRKRWSHFGNTPRLTG